MTDTAVDAPAPVTFGGTVKTVLESAPTSRPAGDARGGAQPARPPRADRGDHAPHRGRGHQVRLLPAGLDHRPRDGQGRRRRRSSRRSPRRATSSSTAPPPTCSPTAPATTSASAPRSPSSPRSPTSTPSPCCRGTPRVARVFCDCYDTETGELLDADPRQNLKRVVAEFEQRARLQFLIGIEPEMMWLRKPRGRRGAARASRSPTATTSTSSRSSVRCCSTSSSTARRSAST